MGHEPLQRGFRRGDDHSRLLFMQPKQRAHSLSHQIHRGRRGFVRRGPSIWEKRQRLCGKGKQVKKEVQVLVELSRFVMCRREDNP